MCKKIIIATTNEGKFREISSYFQDLAIDFLSLKNFKNIPEVIEDGKTIIENAEKKASEISEFTGLPAISDDTGFEVEALNNEPGIFAARYAGENATYDDNIKKLLKNLGETPYEKRNAVFKTVIAFKVPGKNIITTQGECFGFITFEKKGKNGFGYDPIFFVPKFNKTFAEMSIIEKAKISHRAKALEKMRKILQNFIEQ